MKAQKSKTLVRPHNAPCMLGMHGWGAPRAVFGYHRPIASRHIARYGVHQYWGPQSRGPDFSHITVVSLKIGKLIFGKLRRSRSLCMYKIEHATYIWETL